jgi:TIR domain
MAFVPHYTYDIFVSYAHVDDLPEPVTQEGWVTTLVQGLKKRLAQKLGRNDAFTLWMDRELAGNIPITPEIIHTLQHSATLLLILSPGYLASTWCQQEMQAFLHTIRERAHAGSSVFIVERVMLGEDRRPPELQELLGYRFWVADREGKPPRILGDPRPHPDDVRYYEILNDLSCDLAETLQRLKHTPTSQTTAAPAAEPPVYISEARPTVFLAEVTDDLDAQRDAVQRYIEQAGVRVLPETLYSRTPAAFQQALDNDLPQSTIFVQLLSGVLGKKPPDLPQGYVHLQCERARALGTPILQWRSPELDCTTIQDAAHRALLEGETVLATRLEELKFTIVQRACCPPTPLPSKPINALVFVNAEAEDDALAQTVGEFLARNGVASVFPMRGGQPSEVRKDLEDNLLYCDGVIIVYGSIPLLWVRQQLVYCLKQAFRRDQPLKVFAVYEGPPEPKSPLSVTIPHLHIVHSSHGLNEYDLKTLLASLQG